MKILTVACVLKSGGAFKPEHVHDLAIGVATHLRREYWFVCLSDIEVAAVMTVPLVHGWPGWWSKIELFRPGLFDGPVLYFDLDTWIVGSLDEIVDDLPTWGMLADFYDPGQIASGVMAWTPDETTASIYSDFAKLAESYIQRFPGDQDYLRVAGRCATRLQTRFPGKFVSWKEHCAKTRDPSKALRGEIPEGATVVSFHGPPRPWEVER